MATEAPLKASTPPPAESKSARKKKVKAEALVTAGLEAPHGGSQAGSDTPRFDQNGGSNADSAYVKEIQKYVSKSARMGNYG